MKLKIRFVELYRKLKVNDFLRGLISIFVYDEEEEQSDDEENEKVADEDPLLLHLLRRSYRNPFKIKTFVKQFFLLVQLRGS